MFAPIIMSEKCEQFLVGMEGDERLGGVSRSGNDREQPERMDQLHQLETLHRFSAFTVFRSPFTRTLTVRFAFDATR